MIILLYTYWPRIGSFLRAKQRNWFFHSEQPTKSCTVFAELLYKNTWNRDD